MEPIIEIRIASFAESMELKNAITGALADKGVKLEGLDIKDALNQDVEAVLPTLINAVLTIDSNKRVQDALAVCMKRCSYNGESITMDTFENEEARGYYYPIVVDCLKANLAPFLKSLPFASKVKSLMQAGSQA